MRWIGMTAVICAATVAQADDGFDGLYRPAGPQFENWSCEDIGLDGGAFSVQGQQLVMVERWCELNAATAIRDMDAVLYDATCFTEGDTTTERLMLMRIGDGGLALIRDGRVDEWDECIPPA